MIGRCAYCDGPLNSGIAVTVIGAWDTVWAIFRAVPATREDGRIWCSAECRAASKNPELVAS